MDRRRWSMLALLAALGGCHSLLPFSAGGKDSAPAVDSAVADRGWPLDLGLQPDDQGREPTMDLSRPDGCPATGAAGLPPGCFEGDHSLSCASGECCGGGCDLLPEARDPWKTCNQSFVFQPFCPSSLTDWTLNLCSVDANPGILDFSFGIGQSGWTGVVSHTGTTLQPEDLLEMRFQPSRTRAWKLHLVVEDSSATTVRGCMLEHVLGEGFFRMRHATGAIVGTVDLSKTPSGWLVLQSYAMSGYHHCQLHDATGLLAGDSVLLNPGAGTVIELSVTDKNATPGLDVEVDYIRAFHP